MSRTFAKRGILGDEHRPRGPAARVTTLEGEPLSQSPTQTSATLHAYPPHLDPALAAIASGTEANAVSSVQPKHENGCAELSVPAITEGDAGHASDMEIDELDETPPPPATTHSVMPAARGLASTIKTEEETTIRGIRRKFAETGFPGSLDLNVEKELAAKAFPELREKLSELYQALAPAAEHVDIVGCAVRLQAPTLSVVEWHAWRTTVNSGSSSPVKRRRVTPTNPLPAAEITSTSATPFNPSSSSGASAQGGVSQLSRPHAQEPSGSGSLSFSSNRQDTALISASGRQPHLPRSHAESARPLPGPAGTAQEITLSGIAPSRRESLVSPTASVTSALFPSPTSSPASAHARPLPPHDDGWRIPYSTRSPARGHPGTWNPSQQSTPSHGPAQPQPRPLPPSQQRAPRGGNGPHFPAHNPPGSLQPQYPPIAGQHGPTNIPRQQQPVQPASYGAPVQAPTRPTSRPLIPEQLSANALYLQQQQVAQTVHGWQPPPPPLQPLQPATQGLPLQQPAHHHASHLSNQVAGLGGPSYTSNLHNYTSHPVADLLLAQQARQNQNPHPGQAAPPSRHAAPRSSVQTKPRPGERVVPNSYQPPIGIPTPPPPLQSSPVRSISQQSQRSDGSGVPQQQGYAHAPGLRHDSRQGVPQPALRRASGEYQQQSQSAGSVYSQQQQDVAALQQQLALQQRRLSDQYNRANIYLQEPPPADQPPPLGSSLRPGQYQRHHAPVSTAPGPGTYPNAQGPSQQLAYSNQQSPPIGPSAANGQLLYSAHSNPGQQFGVQQPSGNLVPDQRFAGAIAGGAQYPRNMARGAQQPGNGVPPQGHGMRPPSAPRPPSQPHDGQVGNVFGWTPQHDWPSAAPQLQSQPHQGHSAQLPHSNGYSQNQPRESPVQPSQNPYAQPQNPYAQPQQPAQQHPVSSHSVPPPGVSPALANAFDPSGQSQVAHPQQQMAVPDSVMHAARPAMQQYDVPRTRPAPPAQQASPVEPALAQSQAGRQAQAEQGRVPTPSSASQHPVVTAGAGPATQPPPAVGQPAPQVTPTADQAHVCWRAHPFSVHCSLAKWFQPISDAEHAQLTTVEFVNYARWTHQYWRAVQDSYTRIGDTVHAQQALSFREREDGRTSARLQRDRAAAAAAAAAAATTASAASSSGQFSTTLPTPSPTHRFEELPSPPRTATSPLPAVDEQPAAADEPATMLYAFFDLAARGPLDASVVPPAFAALDNTTESVAVQWLMPYFNAWTKLRSPDRVMRAHVQMNMVQYLKQSGAFPQQRVKLELRKPQPAGEVSAGDGVEVSAGDVEMMTPVQKVEELDDGAELELGEGAGTTTIGIATPDPTPEPLQRLEESPPPPPPPPPAVAADWRASIFAKINAM